MQTTYGQHSPESGVQPRVNGSNQPSFAPSRPATVGLASSRIQAGQPRTESPQRTKPVAPAREQDKHSERSLIETLTRTKLFQEYERAFTEATGLPIALRPVESWQLPLHGKRGESPYCALMGGHSHACASCLQMQARLIDPKFEGSLMICPAGLCEAAVPVRLGERVIGYLVTGQVFAKKPTSEQFEKTAEMVDKWGVKLERSKIQEAYFATRVMPAKQQESALTLLRIFAQHLSILSNQVVVQQDNAEPPVITRAKNYIAEHQTENLRLGQVARAVNTSTFYFCKMFKKVAGVNFTDYLSRIRIEKSKNLLLNPNLRISEIAYEVGFQSLTHFNRTFKKLVGQSPTDYREKLKGVGEL